MIVSDILGRVRPLLNDTDAAGYRWSNADLITYVSDGCTQVLIERPDAATSVTPITLSAGSVQSVPDTAYKFLDLVCNLDASDNQGRGITIVDSAVLDSFSPSWRSGTKSGQIKHYAYDPRQPRRFEVYPPALSGTKVQAKVALYTTTLSATTDLIGLSNEYMEHLVCFVLYKAYARDIEHAGNAELAASYLALFNGMLGGKTMKDNAFAPAMNRRGDQPSVPAQQIGGV